MAQRKTASKAKTKPRQTGKAASHKTKSSTATRGTGRRPRAAGSETVAIDRRRGSRRDGDGDEKAIAAAKPSPAKLERRKKVNRRRQIDPTTCERDYTDEEIQFMSALDDYKRSSGRMFPTCSEVLEVVRSLGYAKLSPSELAAHAATQSATQAEPVASAATTADDGSENHWQ